VCSQTSVDDDLEDTNVYCPMPFEGKEFTECCHDGQEQFRCCKPGSSADLNSMLFCLLARALQALSDPKSAGLSVRDFDAKYLGN